MDKSHVDFGIFSYTVEHQIRRGVVKDGNKVLNFIISERAKDTGGFVGEWIFVHQQGSPISVSDFDRINVVLALGETNWYPAGKDGRPFPSALGQVTGNGTLYWAGK